MKGVAARLAGMPAVALLVCLSMTCAGAAQPMPVRRASTDEVRAFCTALRDAEEAHSLDQAVDFKVCLGIAMTVKEGKDGATIKGTVTVRFPAYRMKEVCSASVRNGRVAPETIDCR